MFCKFIVDYVKGCVQGYGNYENLTSSGLDPTELFDDVEDHIPYSTASDKGQQHDNVTQETNSHLTPYVKPDYSLDTNFDTRLDEVSLYTTPSLYSLISVHDDIDNIRGIKKGVSNLHHYYSNIFISCVYLRICLMCYQKRKDLMEQFLTRFILHMSRKEEMLF